MNKDSSMTGTTTMVPGEWKTSKTFGLLWWASEPISMTVRLDSQRYRPGDVMKLDVEINNLSKRKVTDLSAEFVQEATLYADSSSKQCFSPLPAKAKRGHGVPAGESEIWHVEIRIPPIPSKIRRGCSVIDIRAMLKIKAHVSGLACNLKLSCPIIVETGPPPPKGPGLEQQQRSSVTTTSAAADPLLPPAPTSYTRNLHPELRSAGIIMPSKPTLYSPGKVYPDIPPPRYEDVYNFNVGPPKPPASAIAENSANANTLPILPPTPPPQMVPPTQPMDHLPAPPPPPPPNSSDNILENVANNLIHKALGNVTAAANIAENVGNNNVVSPLTTQPDHVVGPKNGNFEWNTGRSAPAPPPKTAAIVGNVTTAVIHKFVDNVAGTAINLVENVANTIHNIVPNPSDFVPKYGAAAAASNRNSSQP